MEKLSSKDGTPIAFDRQGAGPPVILISGASCDRTIHAELAGLLAADYSVLNYDRRGRGDSGDTQPYAIEREIEDLDALVTEAGGAAAAFGNSSGAILALHAVAAEVPLTKLALWEPPFFVDSDAPQRHNDYVGELTRLLDAGHRGDAMVLFMRSVGVPEQAISGMRNAPMWPGMEAIAPTLAYDAAIMGDSTLPREVVSSVAAPTLVIDGSETGTWAAASARALTDALPNPRRLTLEGQNHAVAWDVLASPLREFLAE